MTVPPQQRIQLIEQFVCWKRHFVESIGEWCLQESFPVAFVDYTSTVIAGIGIGTGIRGFRWVTTLRRGVTIFMRPVSVERFSALCDMTRNSPIWRTDKFRSSRNFATVHQRSYLDSRGKWLTTWSVIIDHVCLLFLLCDWVYWFMSVWYSYPSENSALIMSSSIKGK